jgi:hypothetical protein
MAIRDSTKYKISLTIFGIILGLGFYHFRSFIYTSGRIELSTKLKVTEIIGWVGMLSLAALIIYTWICGIERITIWIKAGFRMLLKFKWFSLPGSIVLFVLFPFLIVGGGIYLGNFFTRISIYLPFALVSATFLKVRWQETKWIELFSVSLLILATTYNAASYAPLVSSYPLSMGWSEAGRYYYASIFFDKQIYGVDIPWPHNHFTRYLMQAAPFLFPNLTIWAHRFWQSVLRFLFPFLAGAMLARRMKLDRHIYTISTALWAGLFLFQGPVFYQMLVIVVITLWLFDSKKFWRSFIVVAITSIWAGFTRINWIPMPGLIAASIYLLEQPVKKTGIKSLFQYLLPPGLWVIIGGGMGLLAQQWYALNSGLSPEVIFGYASSDLLWYRLWPNLSYPIGIMPAILYITGPILLFLILALIKWKRENHPIRIVGLVGILLVLFIGGLVVSIKIGGGTNLHNMDAFLTLLMITCVYLFWGKTSQSLEQGHIYKPNWIHLSILIMIPALFAVSYGGLMPELDFEAAEYVVNSLQFEIDRANNRFKDKEILFVSQRQLITFNYLENVELVHDYEKMILSEMAMGNVQVYLDQFAQDIKNQRFSLIIHDVLPGYYKDKETYSFSEENNTYLARVANVLRCHYDIKKRLVPYRIHILTPSEEPLCD